jgi:hypothetical protein
MSQLVEIKVTFTMEVNWDPDDKIPVVMGDRVVGMVTNVEAMYVLDNVTHYEITVLVENAAVKAAAMGAALDPIPPLRMFFPRPVNEINWTMVML